MHQEQLCTAMGGPALPGGVIAVVNMKGGVGKTTTVVSLSETLAALDQKPVLVVDVDAQANASYCLAGNQTLTSLIEANRTADAYFEAALLDGARQPMRELICDRVSSATHLGSRLEVALLASSPALRMVEREIIHKLTEKKYSLHAIEGQAEELLRKDLSQLRESYKYIIFDCAPGISAFTSAAIRVADLVIVPTIPDFLSHLGLTAFVKRVINENRSPEDARPTRVLITRRRLINQHATYVDLIQQMAAQPGADFSVLETAVKEMVALSNALGLGGLPITYRQKYRPNVVDVLTALATDIKDALR